MLGCSGCSITIGTAGSVFASCVSNLQRAEKKMPESPGMTRWILVSLGGFSYLPEDSEDIPFGISGLAPSFIYIPLISPSLIVWYGNCSTESQLVMSPAPENRCKRSDISCHHPPTSNPLGH